ncbi:DUF2802 domain-containing protein [Vibrio genomosp. F10]|uniref:DNA repair protein n=2 Tax=Vibrio genomosp. F10 TaxID=723171 RepID=A0A1B9QX96_9VIBR|nr:DUF2802 domain-containing protein [Vibrio genomosp. F10]OCH74646.1 DNA repair protein [Vibrio genomosp. F10]OEE31957.1 DNA repair protein [Vibrio genomosp. F10 str. ZF-129]OEE93935.1 DNA repair protein [Vibrio genomosp. F10 str. 9ZC157]OEF04937.1 DNA repair protein [Vibrio genomosp. F10 str. 9ZB36]OEF05790.1 DNA repair protein [Vibrio genomosp. F10 str. 9ZD137]
MAPDFLFEAPIIAGALSLVVLVMGLLVYRSKSNAKKKHEIYRRQIRGLDKELQKSSKQLLEVRSVVVGLGQKLSEQQDIIKHLDERVSELEHADSDGRLYTRASKMVQLGAGLHELIEECELPKAEAELMMSLQNKLTGKEKVPPLESTPDKQPQQRPRAGHHRR